MNNKKIKERVLEKLADKSFVDRVLIRPIKNLADGLKSMSEEAQIKNTILKFFNLRDMSMEKQAYVIVTLIRTHDVQLKSPIHKKVLRELAKKNTFVDISF